MIRAKAGDILRHKITRSSYLVIGKSAQGLYVVDLTKRIDPAQMEIILPRASTNFEQDRQMVDMSRPEAEIIMNKLPVIDAIQKTLE